MAQTLRRDRDSAGKIERQVEVGLYGSFYYLVESDFVEARRRYSVKNYKSASKASVAFFKDKVVWDYWL